MGQEPLPGDHLISVRSGYSHHGIYLGGGRVIHYAGWANNRETGPVAETDLLSFTQGKGFRVASHVKAAPAAIIIERARSRIGEQEYNVFTNNCEHFCNWCVTGNHHSSQIDMATGAGAISVASTAGLVGRAAIAVSGPIYGLSGAGVMGGLGAIGGLVGGGAVAGLAILGATPAIATASLVNSTVLADPKEGDPQERRDRRVGRFGSYAGALVGTAGSVAAVSGMGSVAGLSATGITTGLSAIGGLIGGGMGVGVALVTSAPVIAAAAVGYTTYKAAKALARKKR